MKKFIIFAISVILIISSVVIVSQNGMPGVVDEGASLKAEEVAEVNDFADELSVVSTMSMPDISPVFSGGTMSGYKMQSISEKTNGKIDSLTVEFNVNMNIDMQMSATYGENTLPYRVLTTMKYKGVVTMDENAMLFDYSTAEMQMSISDGKTESIDALKMVYPFKCYIDRDNYKLFYYDSYEFIFMGLDLSSEMNYLCGKWISLLDSNDFGDHGENLSEVFGNFQNSLSDQVAYYSDYLNKNVGEKFVNRNGSYYLKQSYGVDFIKGLFAVNLKNNMKNANSEIKAVFAADGVSYRVLSGDLSVKLGKEKIIKAMANYIVTVNLDSDGVTCAVTADCAGNLDYKLYNENSTVVKKPDFNV